MSSKKKKISKRVPTKKVLIISALVLAIFTAGATYMFASGGANTCPNRLVHRVTADYGKSALDLRGRHIRVVDYYQYRGANSNTYLRWLFKCRTLDSVKVKSERIGSFNDFISGKKGNSVRYKSTTKYYIKSGGERIYCGQGAKGRNAFIRSTMTSNFSGCVLR